MPTNFTQAVKIFTCWQQIADKLLHLARLFDRKYFQDRAKFIVQLVKFYKEMKVVGLKQNVTIMTSFPNEQTRILIMIFPSNKMYITWQKTGICLVSNFTWNGTMTNKASKSFYQPQTNSDSHMNNWWLLWCVCPQRGK